MINGQPYTRKACGPCIALKAKCTHNRPCERCVRKGVECVDVVRKPRQKKPKQPMNAIELISQLLPQISPLDLLQLNIPNTLPTPPPYMAPTVNSIQDIPMTTQNPASPLSSSSSNTSPSPSSSPQQAEFSTISNISAEIEKELFGTSDITGYDSYKFTTNTTTYSTQTQLHNTHASSSDLLSPLPSVQSPPADIQYYSTTMPTIFSENITPPPSSPASSPSSPPEPSQNSNPTHSSSSFSLVQYTNIDIRPTQPPPQPTNATSALSDALLNLLQKLSVTSPRQAQEQVVAELQTVKRSVEDFLAYAQLSRPKEVGFRPAIYIMDPSNLHVIDCNESFLKMVGADNKDKIVGNHVSKLCIPFFWRIISRDIEFFRKNKIHCGPRYCAFRHASGGVVYTMGEFQYLSTNHSVMTLGSVFDEIPRCLQIAFYHYLGLSSANNKPVPDCPLNYCHCKMIHLPLPPEDVEL